MPRPAYRNLSAYGLLVEINARADIFHTPRNEVNVAKVLAVARSLYPR